jgi:predicted glycosyltransferase
MARQLSETFDVTVLVDDDMPVQIEMPKSVRLVHLPTSSNEPIVARRDAILSEFERLKPRVVIIDGFPFSQQKRRGELLPLIERARNGIYGESLVVCTTDAILIHESTAGEDRADLAAALLEKYFDLIIVQSDPVFARLDEFFRPKNTVHTPSYHVGFVFPEPYEPTEGGDKVEGDSILVSAGDGEHGGALYRTSIEAQRVLWPVAAIPMRVITGPRFPEDEYQDLLSRAEGARGVSVTRRVDNLPAEMARARYSVSQCDYADALGAIGTRTPSLFVPCQGSRRREQIVRAQRLVYWGAGRLLLPHHLNSASLANEINQLRQFQPRSIRFDTEGAANTVSLIERAAHLCEMGTISSRPSVDNGRPH